MRLFGQVFKEISYFRVFGVVKTPDPGMDGRFILEDFVKPFRSNYPKGSKTYRMRPHTAFMGFSQEATTDNLLVKLSFLRVLVCGGVLIQ
jgi:hypothetical protein